MRTFDLGCWCREQQLPCLCRPPPPTTGLLGGAASLCRGGAKQGVAVYSPTCWGTKPGIPGLVPPHPTGLAWNSSCAPCLCLCPWSPANPLLPTCTTTPHRICDDRLHAQRVLAMCGHSTAQHRRDRAIVGGRRGMAASRECLSSNSGVCCAASHKTSAVEGGCKD